MHTGTLRKRITIQAETSTPDSAGGYALSWTDVATVWADIKPESGREVFIAQHNEGRVTHRVTLRYYAGITTDMRVLYGSRVFNIRGVLNPNEANQWTELLVEEGAGS
jgi:SPP1 family predicted phage head-tail adaptor